VEEFEIAVIKLGHLERCAIEKRFQQTKLSFYGLTVTPRGEARDKWLACGLQNARARGAAAPRQELSSTRGERRKSSADSNTKATKPSDLTRLCTAARTDASSSTIETI
jgi:hypothetical protein